MKKKNWLGLFFTLLLALTLTACGQNKKVVAPQQQLPTAKTILNKAANTNFKNLRATWLQTSKQGQVLQKAAVQYQKKPLVIYANFTTNANHYRMWIKNKQNYIQMQGTATKRWFKTKMTKSSAYIQLTGDLATAAIASFDKESKLFKVSKTASGYQVAYSGKNKKIWRDINQGAMISSVIGIDTDNVKPGFMKVIFKTDHAGHLTEANISAAYRDDSYAKQMKLQIDHINDNRSLKVPGQVISSAVSLEK